MNFFSGDFLVYMMNYIKINFVFTKKNIVNLTKVTIFNVYFLYNLFFFYIFAINKLKSKKYGIKKCTSGGYH